MVLRASFQLNTSISGCQLSGLPQGKGTTFPRQKQEKTAFCVVNRALKSYYIGTQEGCEAVRAFFSFWCYKNNYLCGSHRLASHTGIFFLFKRLKNNCQGWLTPLGALCWLR